MTVVTTLAVGAGRVVAVGSVDAVCVGTATAAAGDAVLGALGSVERSGRAADASGPALANAGADAAGADCGRAVPHTVQSRTAIARTRGSLTLR